MSADLNLLHPLLKPLCEKFVQACKDDGLNVQITYTYRSVEEQNMLYAQGRTVPGRIVTHLKGGQSKHNFTLNGVPASKAFDFVIKDAKGKPVWKVTDKDGRMDLRWSMAIINGKELGLRSGADFRTLKDYGHMELKE